MSYDFPNMPVIPNPVGIDIVIKDIQQALKDGISGLPWLDVAFGRAFSFNQETEGETYVIPKCYDGAGEYINVLPNDTLSNSNLKAHSFISVDGKEDNVDYDRLQIAGRYKRDLNLILWCNLERIDSTKDYIFTEELKMQVEKILRGIESIESINSYHDERLRDIFEGYGFIGRESKYLMYPYSGFRFNLTVNYSYPCI